MTKKPPFRKLRGYAFDPSVSLEIETASINEILYKIPWEDGLKPGPEGEYIKVIDRDPSCDAVYTPVDLNDQYILANDGLEPSESNPQFHQQMVYAVAMNTIRNFEKAIGRKVQWSPVVEDITRFMPAVVKKSHNGRRILTRRYVPQLVLYPHAFRGANAYYSADRKAILFGYFNATPASIDLHMPGSVVYSCLSHDIIAHEISHAILDGMFNRFMEPTHPDVAAFHEGFSDIVALFQHFTFPEVMKHEIAKIRGSFNAETLLGKLAVEFGKASGGHQSLRDGIGETDKTGKTWKRKEADIKEYRTTFECHNRGAILVAAVFDAFITIYNRRASEVIKVATGGTGVLPAGELNTQLIDSLASEAAKTANHVLSMCIRALDYCPPVDITFGDYLRALITADAELVADDKHNYRLAFIDAFRKRGIYPEGINNLSVESLVYGGDDGSDLFDEFTFFLTDFLVEFKNEMTYVQDRKSIFNKTKGFIAGKRGFRYDEERSGDWKGLREYFYETIDGDNKVGLRFEKLTGLALSGNYKKIDVHTNPFYPGKPAFDIQDIRLNNRVGPDGNIQNQVIIIMTQSCGVSVTENDDDYKIATFLHNSEEDSKDGRFLFRGGCTMVFDLNTSKLKHVIAKPILDMEALNKRKPEHKVNQARSKMQYRCQYGDYAEATGIAAMLKQVEAFAHIHHPKTDTNA